MSHLQSTPIYCLLSLVFLSSPTRGCGQDSDLNITLTFELHAPTLAEETPVFITGSIAALGNWNPSAVEMEAIGARRWRHQITAVADARFEYKYTLGTWASEGATAAGHPLQNFVVETNSDMTIHDRIEAWTPDRQRMAVGQITGTVRYHRKLKFDGLLPRDVIVWLPPGYEHSKDRYPVLYMNDGQNIIDPATSAFGVDWRIDETLTQLIDEQKVRPIIVVGIYNTRDRAKDYLPGEQGDRYAEFVRTDLKTLIDETYRTDPSGEATAIGGSSAGGICAFTMAWNHPAIFSKALCMSPAFRYERSDGTMSVDYPAQFIKTSRPSVTPYIYIDNGGVGVDKMLQPGIDQMLKAMKLKGLRENRDFVWKQDANAKHDEAAWAQRLPAALQVLFGRTAP